MMTINNDLRTTTQTPTNNYSFMLQGIAGVHRKYVGQDAPVFISRRTDRHSCALPFIHTSVRKSFQQLQLVITFGHPSAFYNSSLERGKQILKITGWWL